MNLGRRAVEMTRFLFVMTNISQYLNINIEQMGGCMTLAVKRLVLGL
jgi:hypothetical protein